jgi:hypothetical protein
MTPAIKDKYSKLLDALHEKTEGGEVVWQSATDSGTIFAQIGKNTIFLSLDESPDGTDYILSIFNDEGAKVDEFGDADLNARTPKNNSFSSYFSLMRSIYITGERQILGADEVLDDILDTLIKKS